MRRGAEKGTAGPIRRGTEGGAERETERETERERERERERRRETERAITSSFINFLRTHAATRALSFVSQMHSVSVPIAPYW